MYTHYATILCWSIMRDKLANTWLHIVYRANKGPKYNYSEASHCRVKLQYMSYIWWRYLVVLPDNLQTRLSWDYRGISSLITRRIRWVTCSFGEQVGRVSHLETEQSIWVSIAVVDQLLTKTKLGLCQIAMKLFSVQMPKICTEWPPAQQTHWQWKELALVHDIQLSLKFFLHDRRFLSDENFTASVPNWLHFGLQIQM